MKKNSKLLKEISVVVCINLTKTKYVNLMELQYLLPTILIGIKHFLKKKRGK